jgi:16S rRNA (cytidine1402-2'-O)-methyltransferase
MMPDPLYNFLDIQKTSLKSGLYLVATPIGNLRDITLRAIDTLAAADIVACEDTRVSGKLFQALGFKKKLIPYHDHNADTQRPFLLGLIAEGKSVALISDAGMPLISDPGYKLVRDCLDKNIYVTSLPGANSSLMALQLSGLPSDSFTFLGFLSSKTKARKDSLEIWKNIPSTLILFESAARVEDCCKDILEVMGDRPMTLTRELTKKFEDIWPSTASEILARLQKDGPPKGEIVLVIGRNEGEIKEFDINKMLQSALSTMTMKEAVSAIVEATGLPKKQVYNAALEIKNNE